MNYADYQTLGFQRYGTVLQVQLQRPEVLNAADAQMEMELARFFVEVATDALTHVVVLSGQGTTFSAGGDFAYMRELRDEAEKLRTAIYLAKRVIFSLLECPKPVIAKLNGHAIGFGATLALFCDITFAADNARIADPHVTIGLVAGDGGALIWPQLIGYNRAKHYLFTGEPILAPEAERIGLINQALPAAELDAHVQAYAHKLASMPMHALRWTKTTVNLPLRQLAQQMMDASMAYEVLSAATDEHHAALDELERKRGVR